MFFQRKYAYPANSSEKFVTNRSIRGAKIMNRTLYGLTLYFLRTSAFSGHPNIKKKHHILCNTPIPKPHINYCLSRLYFRTVLFSSCSITGRFSVTNSASGSRILRSKSETEHSASSPAFRPATLVKGCKYDKNPRM